MQFKRQATEAVQINMTPLIDVVFLLLIFFMVTTSFPDRQLSLQLPGSATAIPVRDSLPQTHLLSLYSDGRILLNDQEISTPEQLQEQLQQAIAAQDQPALVIRAEAATAHQQVVSALDLARRLGIEQVRIATRPIH